MARLKLPGEALEELLRTLHVAAPVRLPHHLAGRRWLGLGQMVGHVPPLVDLATLHKRSRPGDVANGGAQGLAAIDDHQHRSLRLEPPVGLVAE